MLAFLGHCIQTFNEMLPGRGGEGRGGRVREGREGESRPRLYDNMMRGGKGCTI